MEPNEPIDGRRGKPGPTNGTWVATVLVVGGILIAVVSWKFRRFAPPETTQPATDVSRK